MTKPTVLFLCTHNAGRSQMAMGFFGHPAGDRAHALLRRVRTRRAGESVGDRRDGREGHPHRRPTTEAVDQRDGRGSRRRGHHGLRRHLQRKSVLIVASLGCGVRSDVV